MTEYNYEKTVRDWVTNNMAASLVIGGILILLVGIGIGLGIGLSKGATQPINVGSASETDSSDTIPVGSSAETTAPPSVTPKVYTGTGDDVITIEKPANSAAILKFECPSCTRNTSVKTNGADSLLVNTVGTYSGSHLIDSSEGSNTTQATIAATGAWTLSISGLDQAVNMNRQPVNGQGDSVVYATGETTTATLNNNGDENFVVKVYPTKGGNTDLAVNTIGSYSGTVPLQTPSYIQVTSNGVWSITPK
ncbi:hypothetical protein BH09PAT3_BH09PAT3_7140 [soil metagenome]